MTDRQAAGYRNDRPIALKLEVGAACELEVGAARAVPAAVGCVLVALAQPTVSATGTAMAASTIVSRLDTIMPIRRVPARPGSGRHPAVAKVRPRATVRRMPGVDCPVCQLKENTSRARRRGCEIRSSCTRVRAEP